jgi:hypothetical protein
MKNPLLALSICTLATRCFADEGMWLFNQPPRQLFHDRYKFDVTDEWLAHLQKASVRVGAGGSASFISEDGLLISNHHVGADALQKLSSKEKNYLRDGFYAKTREEEVKCLDLELNVLQSIEDVTARVNAAVPKEADASAAAAARRKITAEIEKESLTTTGLKSDLVTLWQGGAYHLYRYKRYTDVRLVFAPEQQIAFYGGDPDNFEFPRYDLDICLFRAYEEGKPAKIKDYLKVSTSGAKDGDLVFVSGHPARTSRLLTVAEFEDMRDRMMPGRLNSLRRSEVLLSNWSERSPENARRARRDLLRVQNSRKAFNGRLAGLLDPEMMADKVRAENEFRSKLKGKPEFTETLIAYQKIAEATKALASQATRYGMLETGEGFNCDTFKIARNLFRAGDERPKPNGDRLKEFSDANKATFELALFSEKPIYTDLEILTFADSLTALVSELGAGDPLVQAILAGESPHNRAVKLIQGSKVREVAFRRKLYEGGSAALSAANDPMIEMAALIDTEARELRKESEAQTEIRQQAHAAIARARNAILGTAGYPDATFTLRLSFGPVKGYEEDGKAIPSATTIGQLFARGKEMNNQMPFEVPSSWEKHQSQLDPGIPLNFVSTCDIIGGNSGSPVVNRAGEFVGIIFDGNLQSLPWDEMYSDREGRATAVHAAAIMAALQQVYGADALVREIQATPNTKPQARAQSGSAP